MSITQCTQQWGSSKAPQSRGVVLDDLAADTRHRGLLVIEGDACGHGDVLVENDARHSPELLGHGSSALASTIVVTTPAMASAGVVAPRRHAAPRLGTRRQEAGCAAAPP